MQYRVANYHLKFESRLQFGVHFGQEEPDAIATVGLGLVQCQIGAFQKPLRIGSVCRRQCNANADRGDDRPPHEFHWRDHCRGEAAREILGLILIADPGLDDDKLVAAEPGHDIIDAGYRAQAFSDRLEQEITAIVPKSVIDVLEAIEIDKMRCV